MMPIDHTQRETAGPCRHSINEMYKFVMTTNGFCPICFVPELDRLRATQAELEDEIGRTISEVDSRQLEIIRLKTTQAELVKALELTIMWWDNLPPILRQDIEGSGAEPGCIAHARALTRIRSKETKR